MKVDVVRDGLQYRFRFVGRDGKALATSKGYGRRHDAARAAQRLVDQVRDDGVVIVITYPKE